MHMELNLERVWSFKWWLVRGYKNLKLEVLRRQRKEARRRYKYVEFERGALELHDC